MSRRYEIVYEVAADTRYEALTKAISMLRDGVRFLALVRSVELAPGWWKVTLRVSEDS